jgi:hypothetical protein
LMNESLTESINELKISLTETFSKLFIYTSSVYIDIHLK